jgi:hypothetical protein
VSFLFSHFQFLTELVTDILEIENLPLTLSSVNLSDNRLTDDK